MDQILVDVDILRTLQRRAEAMAHSDLSAIGQSVSEIQAIEDLRRAIDVLGTHTEQGCVASMPTSPRSAPPRRPNARGWRASCATRLSSS